MEGPFYPIVDFFQVGNDMTQGLLPKFTTIAPTVTPTAKPTIAGEPTFQPTNEPTMKPSPSDTLRPKLRPTIYPHLLLEFDQVDDSVEDLVEDYFEGNSTNNATDDFFDDYDYGDKNETGIVEETGEELISDNTENDEGTSDGDSSISLSLFSDGIRYLRTGD